MTSQGPLNGHDSRGASSSYAPNDPRISESGGGTYMATSRQAAVADYEAIFGPAARDIKDDPMRFSCLLSTTFRRGVKS